MHPYLHTHILVHLYSICKQYDFSTGLDTIVELRMAANLIDPPVHQEILHSVCTVHCKW